MDDYIYGSNKELNLIYDPNIHVADLSKIRIKPGQEIKLDELDSKPTIDDTGSHYRFEYKGIKLDPYRISQIYGMKSFAMMTILKKCLCAGNRGHNSYREDLLDIINAAQREIEIIDEDSLA